MRRPGFGLGSSAPGGQRRGHPWAVIVVLFAMLGTASLGFGALRPAYATQPMMTPLPSPTPTPPAGAQPNAGGIPVSLSPSSAIADACSGGAPGPIVFPATAHVQAAIVYEDAGSTSDFGVSPGHVLVAQATTKVGTTVAVGDYPLGASLEFYIYTPYFGTTRTSTSQYARIVSESPGESLICFEDGVDGDYNDLIVRVWNANCNSEQLQELGTSSDQIQVGYDPRFLASPSDPDYLAKATIAAQVIQTRGLYTIGQYRSLFSSFGAGSDIPSHVEIRMQCHPLLLNLFETNPPAFTESANLVKFRAGDALGQGLADWVKAEYAAEQTPGVPHPGMVSQQWADTIDHELFHTVQYQHLGNFAWFPDFYIKYQLEGEHSQTESGAQLAQDLVADVDDVHETDRSGLQLLPGSFLWAVNQFLGGTKTIDTPQYSNESYVAAGFYDYLGERFGTGPADHQEQRVAEFAGDLVDVSGLGGVARAMGKRSSLDVVDALRDFLVALYVRKSPNWSQLPPRLRILDEIVLHDQPLPPLQNTGPNPALNWGDVATTLGVQANDTPVSDTLDAASAKLYEVTIPGGTPEVRVTIVDDSGPIIAGRAGIRYGTPLRLGFAPVTSQGDVVIDPAFFKTGPVVGQSAYTDIPVAGMAKLGIAVVGLSRANFTIRVTPRPGPAGITLSAVSPVTQAHLDQGLEVLAHPTMAGVPSRGLPKSAYTATIDGTTEAVTGAFDAGSTQVLFVALPSSLAVGTHTVELTYGTASSAASFDVVAGGGGTLAQPLGISDTGTVRGTLLTSSAGSAGTPLDVSYIVTQGSGAVTGAAVTASVTDPLGTVRVFPLADEGSDVDAASNDGDYGAHLFGTNAPGTYTIQVTATGTDAGGSPFRVSDGATLSLGPMIDGDGDGVADSVEPQFGLNPADPTDGARDLDGDGVGTAAELAAGTDPLNPDTDGGGESDGSELAAGRDPRNPSDDVQVPDAVVAAQPVDGRSVQVSAAAGDGTVSVHVYRVGDAGTVDLGLHPGAGETFTDGPLTAGTYQYYAVTETASGARGSPTAPVSAVVADDVTPPFATLVLDDGRAVTSNPLVNVSFVAPSETVASMRLAESAADLEAAPWAPFAAQTMFNLASSSGTHTVLAQLRDAAGNVSTTLVGTIILDQVPPTSAVGSVPSTVYATALWVPWTAADDNGLAEVQLWQRYKATPTSTWSAWTMVTMSETSPTWFTLQNGQGYYELASTAIDLAGNQEALPAVGDVALHYGPERVNDDTGTAWQGSPAVTAGLDGNVYAVWSDARNSSSVYDLYFARRDPATMSWSANQRVDDSAASVSRGSIAVDANGNAYAVWVDSRRGDPDIWFSKRSASTGLWSVSARVNDDGAGSAQDYPHVAVSASGEAIAVWTDGRSKRQYIYGARLPAGATQWSANFPVASDTRATKSAPDLVIGPDGTAYAVWGQAPKSTWST